MTSPTTVPTVTLNDENTIPVLGFGVDELSETETERAVAAALESGYRLIDTAAAYGNEAAVGRAIAASGIPRAEVFVTAKLAIADLGFQSSQDAAKASAERLGLDYLDLYQIHWPAGESGKYVDSWGGLLRLKEDGVARSIGVSNFNAETLSNIIDLSFSTPAINQIELHPLLNQAELRQVNAGYEVTTAADCPVGVDGLTHHPAIVAVAQTHGKTPAQVLIRWNLQLGNVVIPRSVTTDHIRQNLEVFDFELSDDEMTALNGLDAGTRYRPDPETYTGS